MIYLIHLGISSRPSPDGKRWSAGQNIRTCRQAGRYPQQQCRRNQCSHRGSQSSIRGGERNFKSQPYAKLLLNFLVYSRMVCGAHAWYRFFPNTKAYERQGCTIWARPVNLWSSLCLHQVDGTSYSSKSLACNFLHQDLIRHRSSKYLKFDPSSRLVVFCFVLHECSEQSELHEVKW